MLWLTAGYVIQACGTMRTPWNNLLSMIGAASSGSIILPLCGCRRRCTGTRILMLLNVLAGPTAIAWRLTWVLRYSSLRSIAREISGRILGSCRRCWLGIITIP